MYNENELIKKKEKENMKNKKLLSLGAVFVSIVPLAMVVSCGANKKGINLIDEKNKLNAAINLKKSKIMITKTGNIAPTVNEILSELGFTKDEGFTITSSTSLIQDKYKDITFTIAKNNGKETLKSTTLKVGWITIEEQKTIYKTDSGEIKTSTVHDLSVIKGENITIIQIGFSKINEIITADRMPFGVIKVPTELPFNITSTNWMFYNCKKFNQNINNWDVSNVTNMNDMFENCSIFNQNLSSWKTGNVKDMKHMFWKCSAFNQNINNWDVSKVENMSAMFFDCSQFNQPLNKWNVSKVEDMSFMFAHCIVFNQNLSSWNFKKVDNNHENFNSNTPAWTDQKPHFN